MKNLRNIYDIFEEIRTTSSIKDKKIIINKHKENDLFIKCLEFLGNNYKITGISKKKISKDVKLIDIDKETTLSDVIDYIVLNNTGRHEDISFIKSFIKLQDEDLHVFLEDFFTKSYKLGASKKVINSVLGESFLDDFKVMKSTNYEECCDVFNKRAEKDGYAIYLKENGIRGEIIVDDDVKIRSRQGLYVYGFVDLEKAFNNLPKGLYEGEIVAIGEFKNSNERCQKTRSIYSKNGIKHGVKVRLFDYISLEDMKSCQNNIPISKRKAFIKNIANQSNSEFIDYLEPLYEGKDISMIDIKLKEVIKMNEEGISCNILTAPYEFKRSKWAVKVKEFNTIDLKIVDVYEGDQKYKGKMGGMTVRYKNNTVNVGSGWSDEEREYYWKNKEEYIGRVLEVKYKDETIDKDTGLPSLQFPIKVDVREINKEISYS